MLLIKILYFNAEKMSHIKEVYSYISNHLVLKKQKQNTSIL